MSICHKYTASFAFRYSAPNSALAANDMSALTLIIVAIVRMVLLLGGFSLSLDWKKCPPTLLCDFFFLQDPALLCTASI